MTWEKYKELLLKEKEKLEKELSQIATKSKDPQKPNEWEVKAPDMNPMVSDQSELADMFEELETQAGLEIQLEDRYKAVAAAIDRIDKGIYGKCSVGGEDIEEKRLEAILWR